MFLFKPSINILKKETWFSNTSITDDNEFEYVSVWHYYFCIYKIIICSILYNKYFINENIMINFNKIGLNKGWLSMHNIIILQFI